MTMLSPAEEQGIYQRLQQYADAWNQHDMSLYAACFTNDAYVRSVHHLVTIGQQAIRRGYAHAFLTFYRRSLLEYRIETLHPVKPDVVNVVCQQVLLHSRTPIGNGVPRLGVICYQTLVRQEQRWLVHVCCSYALGEQGMLAGSRK